MSNAILFVTALVLGAAFLTSCNEEPEPASAGNSQQQQTGPGWFVASEINVVNHDSFLVYIDKPEDARRADQMIAHQISSENFDAHIAAGSDGLNRNVNESGGLYHWHVTEFGGFEIQVPAIVDPYLNGTPTLIESDVDGWIEHNAGRIAFPNYTITARFIPSGNG